MLVSGPLTAKRALRHWSALLLKDSRGGEASGHKSDEEQLGELELFNLKNMKLRGHFIILYKYLKEVCSQVGIGLFFQVTRHRVRENGLKLPQRGFKLDIGKNFIMEKMARH